MLHMPCSCHAHPHTLTHTETHVHILDKWHSCPQLTGHSFNSCIHLCKVAQAVEKSTFLPSQRHNEFWTCSGTFDYEYESESKSWCQKVVDKTLICTSLLCYWHSKKTSFGRIMFMQLKRLSCSHVEDYVVPRVVYLMSATATITAAVAESLKNGINFVGLQWLVECIAISI